VEWLLVEGMAVAGVTQVRTNEIVKLSRPRKRPSLVIKIVFVLIPLVEEISSLMALFFVPFRYCKRKKTSSFT